MASAELRLIKLTTKTFILKFFTFVVSKKFSLFNKLFFHH